MTTPRHLKNPPITEALLDFRVDEGAGVSPAHLPQLRERVGSGYTRITEQERFQASVEATPGRLPETRARNLGLFGWAFSSPDGRQVAQFRSDGFTLNRLAPYTSWPELFPEAMRLWKHYVQVVEPQAIRRMAVRYINHIKLDGLHVKLEDYLRAPLPLPEGLPSTITSFLTSVVLHDEKAQSSVRVTQSLEPPHETQSLVFLLDIDAYSVVEKTPQDSTIEPTFEHLRTMKNNVFFSSLHEGIIARFA